MKPLISDFPPRRRQRVNWFAMFLPLYFAAMVVLAAYAVHSFNPFRINADAAVERWAQQVGVE